MTGTRVKIQYRGVVSEIYQTSKLTIGVSSNLLGKLQKLEKHVTTADPTRPDLVDKRRSQGPVTGFKHFREQASLTWYRSGKPASCTHTGITGWAQDVSLKWPMS